MCFYELLTYSCTAERAHLVELCPIPGHCLPHMVRTKHSTAVCDPCAEAWTLLTMAWERQVAEEKYFEAMMRDLHVAGGRYFNGDTKACRTEEERSGASVEEIGVVTDERRSVSSAPSSELVYRARRASC